MKKRILVRGPCLSQSGYGEQTRFALRALRSREDLFEIYIQPINWGKTGWIWDDNEFRKWMDQRLTATQILIQQKKLELDISLQITIPPEWEKLAPVNIGYTAGIETTHVAPQWLVKGNEMDNIIVVSNHAKNTYVQTSADATNNETGETMKYSLNTPVDVVNYCVRHPEIEEIPGFDLSTDFNFLAVSQWGPRKNFENTIKWWVEEFFDKNIGLLIKTNTINNSISDFNLTNRSLKTILSKYKDRKCKVHLLHGDLSEGQMAWLYRHDKIKCLINIAHGEGFGLPMFEAAQAGLPIITIGWSGQLDFLTHKGKKYFQEVEHIIQPVQPQAVWEGVIEKTSQWAFAEPGSYKMTLRKTHKKWKTAKKTAVSLTNILNKELSEEKIYQQFCDSVYKPDEEAEDWMKELEEMVSVG